MSAMVSCGNVAQKSIDTYIFKPHDGSALTHMTRASIPIVDIAWIKSVLLDSTATIYPRIIVFDDPAYCMETTPLGLTDVLDAYEANADYAFNDTDTRTDFVLRLMVDLTDALLCLHTVHAGTHGSVDAESIVFHRNRWTLRLNMSTSHADFAKKTHADQNRQARLIDFLQFVHVMSDIVMQRLLPAKLARMKNDQTQLIVRKNDVVRICSLRDVQNGILVTPLAELPPNYTLSRFFIWFTRKLMMLTPKQSSFIHTPDCGVDGVTDGLIKATPFLTQSLANV